MKNIKILLFVILVSQLKAVSQTSDTEATFKTKGLKVELGFGGILNFDSNDETPLFNFNQLDFYFLHPVKRNEKLGYYLGTGFSSKAIDIDIPINNEDKTISLNPKFLAFKNRVLFTKGNQEITLNDDADNPYIELNGGLMIDKLFNINTKKATGFFFELGAGIITSYAKKNKRGKFRGFRTANFGISVSMYSFKHYYQPTTDEEGLKDVVFDLKSYSITLKYSYAFGYIKRKN